MLLFALLACTSPKPKYVTLRGNTMGTTFSITCPESATLSSAGVASLLKALNASMSTWDTASVITTLNRASAGEMILVDTHFVEVFRLSREVHRRSNGAFDPSVMPLVRYWGFAGSEPPRIPDSTEIDRLRRSSRLDDFSLSKVILEGATDTLYYMEKARSTAALDFSAVAKGYAVDCVASWIARHGIVNYMIEIGGEVRIKGTGPSGHGWRIALENPVDVEPGMDVYGKLVLNSHAVATSGNYRNQKATGTLIYGHSLDPASGFPIQTEVLSATVISTSCAASDAWATAFMVMGMGQAVRIIDDLAAADDQFGAILTTHDTSGYMHHSYGIARSLLIGN